MLFLLTIFNVNAATYDFSLRDQQLKEHLHQITKSNHRRVLGYGQARTELLGVIHLQKDEQGKSFLLDIYCLERYGSSVGVGHRKVPNHNVINTEHVWPQSRFTNSFPKSTQKSDLHHLYPSNSQANSTRGNIKFGLTASSQPLKNCEASQTTGKLFAPPAEYRGNIARAIFYFSVRYRLAISPDEEMTLRQWHQEDPIDEDERARNGMIEMLQGNTNPFIDHEFLVDYISNF